MKVRLEAAGEEEAVRMVTEAAFKDVPHSDQTEAAIIAALRGAGALTVSLVATEAGTIVGHVAFSTVTMNGEDHGWYGLGPVSVIPARQGKGIGSALIDEGLARLKALGAQGCVVLGDPAYYGRFGFRSDDALTYADAPGAYFQALDFTGHRPGGAVAYHAAFDAK